ncbi:E3 ubiquitin-protein ligase RNF183 [Gouania willdenowi]|uniref:RING finger protein 225-like n=1 Tax=Gouania willdenowi TaxID=441366 RepID=A0A8C5DPF4_GOUWI|nr:RING finger protein 225-like [Gouania willdenowi]
MSDDGNGRPAQNVKPKLGQNTKEDMLRKGQPVVGRRSRSSDSQRSERGRRREQERGQRRRRGRSEEARQRPRRTREGDGRTTGPTEPGWDDTECAVCFCSYDNIFKTPKLLACGHTFCLECLARINVTTPEIKTLSCPVCRELTELPHGQDLPRLGNNQDIISRLPPDMQRALSIRFKRRKGKLMLKRAPPTKPTVLSLPVKSREAQAQVPPGGVLNQMEEGVPPATVLNVGRPPSRVRGRLRRLFRSDQCYYAVVGSIITITVALMLIGILAFIIIPNVSFHRPPPTNNTGNRPPTPRP